MSLVNSSQGRAIWPSQPSRTLTLGRNEPPTPRFPRTIETKGFYVTLLLFVFVATVQNIYIPLLAFVVASNFWGIPGRYLGKLYVGLLLLPALPLHSRSKFYLSMMSGIRRN